MTTLAAAALLRHEIQLPDMTTMDTPGLRRINSLPIGWVLASAASQFTMLVDSSSSKPCHQPRSPLTGFSILLTQPKTRIGPLGPNGPKSNTEKRTACFLGRSMDAMMKQRMRLGPLTHVR